jgi:hypothetical protein
MANLPTPGRERVAVIVWPGCRFVGYGRTGRPDEFNRVLDAFLTEVGA